MDKRVEKDVQIAKKKSQPIDSPLKIDLTIDEYFETNNTELDSIDFIQIPIEIPFKKEDKESKYLEEIKFLKMELQKRDELIKELYQKLSKEN